MPDWRWKMLLSVWRAENDPDPAGKAGVSAVSTCQWSANGKFLIADQEVTNGGAVFGGWGTLDDQYARKIDKDPLI